MEKSLQRYLRWYRSAGHPAKTIAKHSHTISLFIRWLQDEQYSTVLNDLEADFVREWIEDQQRRGLSDQTFATRVRVLRAFTHWLTDDKWLDKDPLQRLTVPKADDKAEAILTPEEGDTLLTMCDKKTTIGRRDFSIMLLLFSTGLRATELLNLHLEDIEWTPGRGLIVVRRGKRGKFRVVPLSAKVERTIDRYLDGRETGPVFLTNTGQPLQSYGYAKCGCALYSLASPLLQ